MSSPAYVVNLAFDRIGERTIVSLDDPGPIVARAKAQYSHQRDLLLRAQPWRFAMARAELAALSDAPTFGWDRAFERPSNALRVMPLTTNGEYDGLPVEHRFEGTQILTNATAPLKIRYVQRDVPETKFDPLFTELLAINIALQLSYRLTNKRSLVAELRQEARELSAGFFILDAIEGSHKYAQGDEVLQAGYAL
jgi:hypothetical protein